VGVDDAGADGVDPDVGGCVVQRGERLGVLLDAGVVDRDVEVPERRDRLVECGPDLVGRGAVAANGEGASPASSISRADSRLSCSDTSATTTLAPSRAKASAVARPMPGRCVAARGQGRTRTLIARRESMAR
jgi:hypothetical protein